MNECYQLELQAQYLLGDYIRIHSDEHTTFTYGHSPSWYGSAFGTQYNVGSNPT